MNAYSPQPLSAHLSANDVTPKSPHGCRTRLVSMRFLLDTIFIFFHIVEELPNKAMSYGNV
jgi:hypothetical protein